MFCSGCYTWYLLHLHMRYLRLLLLPFSIIYALIMSIRNALYDIGLFKSKQFPIPVINVGNLIVGGSGKSPQVEYIVRLLQQDYRIAVLSRGYGRHTKGFRYVSLQDNPLETGDEPLQIKKKFPSITVAVCEDRVLGIEQLRSQHDVVLLDDAFQHRRVRSGLNILLFDYIRIDQPKLVFPAGNYREPFCGRKRASIIVITKTPEVLSVSDRNKISGTINPFRGQELFFSFLRYGNLISVNDSSSMPLSDLAGYQRVLLLTGIANTLALEIEINRYAVNVAHHKYPDHYQFTTKNISKLVADYRSALPAKQIIVTTEKDAQRLLQHAINELLTDLPVYYLPIEAAFSEPERSVFDQKIKEYVSKRL